MSALCNYYSIRNNVELQIICNTRPPSFLRGYETCYTLTLLAFLGHGGGDEGDGGVM